MPFPGGVNVKTRSAEWMTVKAVGFERITPVARVLCFMLFVSDQFQMLWIYAATRFASMMEQKSTWNRVLRQQFVDHSVDGNRSSGFAHRGVSIGSHISRPQPATRIGFDDNFLSQTLGKSVKFDLKHTDLIVAEMPRWGQFV